MVEKIIMSPQRVRACGNIAFEKDLTDFETYMSSIIQTDAVINNISVSAFIMEYSLYGVSFGYDNGKMYVTSNDGVVTAFEFDDENERIIAAATAGVSLFEFDDENERLHMRVE